MTLLSKFLYPTWPLPRMSWSHDVQKHGVLIPGYSRLDGWSRLLNRICSCLRERKCGPCPFSTLLSHGNGHSMCARTYTHVEVGTGQCRSPQRRRVTSENSNSRARSSYTSLGGTANEKSRGPSQKLFFFSFQGKMPRAIEIEHCNWIEKADVPYSGLREVRAGRNAFRNALRGV